MMIWAKIYKIWEYVGNIFWEDRLECEMRIIFRGVILMRVLVDFSLDKKWN